MNHFADCQTVETKKQVYRQLAQELHPDLGGTTEAMQELNRQYWESLNGGNYLEDDSEYACYSSGNIESALIDPRRPVIVLSVNFGGLFVGFSTLDSKISWAMKVDLELKTLLKERSRLVAVGHRQIALTATEFAEFSKRGK